MNELLPGATTHSPSLLRRFWQKVDIPRTIDDCWLWTAVIDPQTGYGRIGAGGRGEGVHNAHRLSFEIHHGEALGLVLHKCGNKQCVNPLHLYDGTHSSNARDAWRLGEWTFTETMRASLAKAREAKRVK